MEKEELLKNLRELLQSVLKARFDGAAYAKLTRAHGYADGYMRALLDVGVVDRKALLGVIGEERQRYVAPKPQTAPRRVSADRAVA